MSTAENKNEVFKQNLDTKGEFQHIFQIHLLFKEEGKSSARQSNTRSFKCPLRENRHRGRREKIIIDFRRVEIPCRIQGQSESTRASTHVRL